jgi:hypothetical protein
MKIAKITLMSVMLILAAAVVWAQCPVACQQPVQCPTPCPVQCPQPCPQPCPQECPPVCTCPSAVAAAMGAGPAADLQGLECPNFDPAYIGKMVNQYTKIANVTAYGAQYATDSNLRAISREINGYMTSATAKLQGGFGCLTCPVAVDCNAGQDIISQLPCDCFNQVYATTLAQMLTQAQNADTIAAAKSTCPGLRQQAQFLSGKESNWIFRLNRWVGDHP